MESTSPRGDSFDYIDIDAIDNQRNIISSPKHIPVKDAPSRASRKTQRGDVLFSMVRPYLRNIARVDYDNCIASTGFFVCHSSGLVTSDYCFILMLSNYVVDGLNQYMKGDNSPSINNNHITSWLYPIPPIAEQKRISATVELLLNCVNDLVDTKKRILESIVATKTKILELSIHGKLVPQNPADEPAIELLMRINPDFKASDNLHYDEVPQGWVLCNMGEITNYGKCLSVQAVEIQDSDWVLELEDIEKGTGRLLRRVLKKERAIKGIRHRFSKGQVLYPKLRTYLNKVLIADDNGYCTTEIIPITPCNGLMSQYLNIVLRSPFFLDYTARSGYGVKMPRLGTNDAKKAVIPIPPLPEQQRIVTAVDRVLEKLDLLIETIK